MGMALLGICDLTPNVFRFDQKHITVYQRPVTIEQIPYISPLHAQKHVVTNLFQHVACCGSAFMLPKCPPVYCFPPLDWCHLGSA